MNKKTNKLEELEKSLHTKKTKDKLFNIMDPFVLGIDEMKKSFSNLFVSNKGNNKITLNMDRFEKKWKK